MFPDRYSQIFGLGEQLGCILNLSHSFDAIEAYEFASMSITLAPIRFYASPILYGKGVKQHLIRLEFGAVRSLRKQRLPADKQWTPYFGKRGGY